MSQPIGAEALSYARTLPVDEHQRAWRSVARIIGVACICYGLFWLATVAANVVFGGAAFGSSGPMSNQAGWRTTYQFLAPWAFGLASVGLIVGGLGTVVCQPAMRRLLVGVAALQIVLTLVSACVLGVELFGQLTGHPWRPGTGPSMDEVYLVARSLLAHLIYPVLLCGLTIALLTRRPLIKALEAIQPRILPAGLQILLALALVVGMTGLIARPLTLFMDIAAPVLQDKGVAYGVGFTDVRGGPSLASAWYVSTRVVLWICSGLMVIGALAGLGLRLWGLQLLMVQARVAIVINVVDLFLGATMLSRPHALASSHYVIAGFVVQGSMIVLDSILLVYLTTPAVRAAIADRHVLQTPPATPASIEPGSG